MLFSCFWRGYVTPRFQHIQLVEARMMLVQYLYWINFYRSLRLPGKTIGNALSQWYHLKWWRIWSKFSRVRKNGCILNQERFTLAIDDTEEPRNGAKKNSNTSTSFWWSVWKTWREKKSITLEIEEYEQADMNRSLEKFYAEVKNNYGLLALSPRECCHVYIACAMSDFSKTHSCKLIPNWIRNCMITYTN